MSLYSITMIVIAFAATFAIIYYYLKPDPLADLDLEVAEDPHDLEVLIVKVKDELGNFDKLNVTELNMTRSQTEKIKVSKRKLNKARATCCYGDLGAKAYVKGYVKKILLETCGVSENNIFETIPFDKPDKLDTVTKFQILLYVYKQMFDKEAMSQFMQLNHLDEPYGEGCSAHYKITAPQIERLYDLHAEMIAKLTYEDHLEMLTQKVYERYLGLGIVDELLEMDVDSVRAGTSGTLESLVKVLGEEYNADHGALPNVSYNSVWIMYKGNDVHLSFLGFGTQKEFQRVCSRIYRYNDPGTLSASTGFILSEMMNGSRVVVTRPPAVESWAFFVRKLDIASKAAIEILHPDKGNEKMIELLKWIVGGQGNLALTGSQGTGKTTFMMALIQFIKEGFTIRVQELAPELNLRKVYPEKDILSFRPTDTISGQEELNIKKKTDGAVDLVGEVADAEQGAWVIQTGETGSNQVMFTGHMKTARLLVEWFRDACLEVTPGSNEKTKESLCARVLTYNCHLTREQGHRFIERITMIVPHVLEDYPEDLEAAQKEYYYRQTDRPVFDTIDLLRFEDGEYKFTGNFTAEKAGELAFHLSDNERAEFADFLERMQAEVAEYEAEHPDRIQRVSGTMQEDGR